MSPRLQMGEKSGGRQGEGEREREQMDEWMENR